MTQPPQFAGPACDFCTEEEAVGSLMLLADYTTLKFGPACGPRFLRDVAGQLAGDPEPEETPEPATAEQAAADAEATVAAEALHTTDDCPVCGSAVDVADIPDHVAMHAAEGEWTPGARDHWASTSKVVRSTHGHRAPRGASGMPESEPEA